MSVKVFGYLLHLHILKRREKEREKKNGYFFHNPYEVHHIPTIRTYINRQQTRGETSDISNVLYFPLFAYPL